MTDFTELSAIIAKVRRDAVISELGSILLSDQEVADKIVKNLRTKGFEDITTDQALEIMGKLDPSFEKHNTPATDPYCTEPKNTGPTASAMTTSVTQENISIYPSALPGWDQRATHAIARGYCRAFARYDIDANYMMILAGSVIASEWTGEEASYGDALENLLTLPGIVNLEGSRAILIEDVLCASPACAASIVLGRSTSSTEWTDGHNRSMQKPKRNTRHRFENNLMAIPIYKPKKENQNDDTIVVDTMSNSPKNPNPQSSLNLMGSVSDISLSGLQYKSPVKDNEFSSQGSKPSRRKKRRR